MPDLTTKEWFFLFGLYLITSSLTSLAIGFVRGWRGPSNRDLSNAVLVMTKWMQKTNKKMAKEQRGQVVSISVAASGAMSSTLAPPERTHAR